MFCGTTRYFNGSIHHWFKENHQPGQSQNETDNQRIKPENIVKIIIEPFETRLPLHGETGLPGCPRPFSVPPENQSGDAADHENNRGYCDYPAANLAGEKTGMDMRHDKKEENRLVDFQYLPIVWIDIHQNKFAFFRDKGADTDAAFRIFKKDEFRNFHIRIGFVDTGDKLFMGYSPGMWWHAYISCILF